LLEKYNEKIKIAFKNFPLSYHKFAMKAAIGALAAGSQGKFWEFHDLLFENYNKLNDRKIGAIVQSLSLDELEFEKSVKDPVLQRKVRQDLLDGQQAGVKGIPTVFINGRLLRDMTLRGFQTAIDKELKKIGKNDSKPVSCN